MSDQYPIDTSPDPIMFLDQQSIPYSAGLKLFWWVIGLFLDGLKIIQDWMEYLDTVGELIFVVDSPHFWLEKCGQEA